MFAREMLKVTFLLSYFCVTKRRVQGGEATSERCHRDGVYQKSARRTCAVLLPNHRRRARVSRASRAWQVRAANGRAKAGDFAALRNLILPRVRTYHTKKPSRFVHALSARPHIKVRRGLTHMRSMCVGVAETGHRGVGLCADGMGRWAKAHGWRCVAWRKNMPKSGRTYCFHS